MSFNKKCRFHCIFGVVARCSVKLSQRDPCLRRLPNSHAPRFTLGRTDLYQGEQGQCFQIVTKSATPIFKKLKALKLKYFKA